MSNKRHFFHLENSKDLVALVLGMENKDQVDFAIITTDHRRLAPRDPRRP